MSRSSRKEQSTGLDGFFSQTSPAHAFVQAVGGEHFVIAHKGTTYHLVGTTQRPEGLSAVQEFSAVSPDGRWRIDMGKFKSMVALLRPGHCMPLRLPDNQQAIVYVDGGNNAVAPPAAAASFQPMHGLFSDETYEFRKLQRQEAFSSKEVLRRLDLHGGPLEVYAGVTFLGYIFPEDEFAKFHPCVVQGDIQYQSFTHRAWHNTNPFQTNLKMGENTLCNVPRVGPRYNEAGFFAVPTNPHQNIERILFTIEGYAACREYHEREAQMLADAQRAGVNLLRERVVSTLSSPLIEAPEPSTSGGGGL